MRVRVLGAGAVGAPLALALSAVSDLALIAEGERRERLESGIVINGKKHVFSVESVPERAAELAVVALKNFHLEEALPLLDPFIGPETVILPLMNGIDAIDILSERYGKERVLCSFMTDISSSHVAGGIVCFHPGTVVLGERENILSERLRSVTRLFGEAGVSWEIPHDINRRMWHHLMVGASFCTLSAVLGADYDAMNRNGPLKRCARMIARETVLVANSEGVHLGQEDIESMIECFSRLTGEGKTGMLEDTELGNETENEWLLGAVLRRAKRHGIKVPCSEYLYMLEEARRKVVVESRRIDEL